MLHRDVAPGIHRVEDANTNWYLVEDGDRLTIVDAGVRTSWPSFLAALDELGHPAGDVDALILTHAHFDHIGFAERARRTYGIPVWVHDDDVPLTKHPLQYARERHPLLYVATRPRALPIVAGFVAARAFFPTPIGTVRRFGEQRELHVPGSPVIVPTPGHTLGHVAFHFPDRDAVIAGDAVVTLDPYTAQRGPRLVARGATADLDRAVESLDALAATNAKIVLTGHGEPWTDGAVAMAEQARAAGSA